MKKRNKKDDFEDDGRVIADMSGVGRPPLFAYRAPDRAPSPAPAREHASKRSGDAVTEQRDPAVKLTKKERLWMILGALKAGLSVSIVYVVFLAVLIGIMLLVWHFL